MPTPSGSLVPSDQLNSAAVTKSSQSQQKTRFIGKHSRDNRLSIFLNQRNSNTPTDLLGLVRINRDALHLIQEKGATVVVGVMARLLCDHGLQFSEHFVYQRETTIYPSTVATSCQEIELVQGILGDAVLPDEFHRGFKLKLPIALPPSCIFLSPDTSMGPGITGDSPWGLTYYLYAYLCTQPHHRKSSKVFLSFTRAIPSNPAQLVKETEPPAATVAKASNLSLVGTGKPLALNAALDRSFFYTGDQMAVHVRIDNPRSINFTGIRITLKQIITMRALNQGRQIIKVPLAAYEFKSIDANGKFQRSNPISPCAPKDFPFIVDTIRINLKPGHDLQHVAVESILPRNSIKSLILCPSFAQTYEMQDNPLKYFSIEYYMNVHVVMPWGTNLIAKLPFTVASRGVEDNSALNSSTLVFDDLSGNNDDDFEENEKIFEEARSASETRKQLPVAGAVHVDFKIVKCDMERSLQLLEASRNAQTSRVAPSSLGSFEQMRRTWVREFAEACHVVSSYLTQLDNLFNILVTCSGEKYSPGFPVDLVRSLYDRFVPFYTRFLRQHSQSDRAPVFEDALNQFLDTLELVLMKFHLLAGRESHSDTVEINLDDLLDVLQGRLRKEFDKLTLVVPGIIEWRWLLEELFYKRSDSSEVALSSHDSTDIQMVKLFQSIHSRLSESFSDSQIDPQEIFTYSQLLFSTEVPLPPRAYQAHYNYFKVAFLVYYGNYQKTFLQFDAVDSEKNLDLKEMRERLKRLREELIQSMIK